MILKFEFFTCLLEFGVCGYDHIDLAGFCMLNPVSVSHHDIMSVYDLVELIIF